jgi:putative ABC transport system permease protein
MSLLSVLTLVVGMFLIYNTVSVSVAERRLEIGILRALGTRRREVALLFALEALGLGLAGSAIGVAAGVTLAQSLVVLVCQTLTSVVAYTDVRELALGPEAVLVGILAGALASVAAALFPAWRAARVTPLEATRPTTEEPARKWRARLSAGLGLLFLGSTAVLVASPASRESEPLAFGTALALVVGFALVTPSVAPWLLSGLGPLARILFGVVGRLAADQVLRAPGRASVTIGAIVLGFGLVLSTASVTRSFQVSLNAYAERSVVADILVTSTTEIWTPAAMPMAPSVGIAIRAVPDVEEVQRLRVVDTDLNGRRADLFVLDIQDWDRRVGFSLVSGDHASVAAGLRRGEGIAVSENLAHKLKLQSGDRVRLRTPKGRVEMPVLGVFLDYSSAFGVVAIDRALFARYRDDDLTDLYYVFLRPGADAAAAQAAIREVVARQYHAFVLTNAELRRKLRGLIDDTFTLARLLEIIALAVALLGLLNTLLISVLQRTREIGILRAIGARRRQVALGIGVESALLGLAGALLGVILGLALSWVNVEVLSLVQTGWRLEYHFDEAAMWRMLGLSLVTAVAAACLPARRAARINVSAAMEYE